MSYQEEDLAVLQSWLDNGRKDGNLDGLVEVARVLHYHNCLDTVEATLDFFASPWQWDGEIRELTVSLRSTIQKEANIRINETDTIEEGV